jgi:transcriptional regulator
MYIADHFRESDSDAINALIRHFPLATVVLCDVDGIPQANHYPLLLEVDAAGDQKLCGHLPKYDASEIFRAQAPSALAIFQGPSAYVSPSFYPSKALTGKVVPTWNYLVVHARGTLTLIDDPSWVHEHLDAMTAQMESTRPSPWKVADAPTEYARLLQSKIFGFEIAIESIEAKFKSSQNKSKADREGVRTGLDMQKCSAPPMYEFLVKD